MFFPLLIKNYASLQSGRINQDYSKHLNQSDDS